METREWWVRLDNDLKDLLRESLLLAKIAGSWNEKFHDYAFVVFPAAKAYEGFLKSLFFDRGFISQEDYFGKKFRVGKALNPALEPEFRERESVYDKIAQVSGKDTADLLWETWRVSRNLIFHWFPEEQNAISLAEAKDRIRMVIGAIDKVYSK